MGSIVEILSKRHVYLSDITIIAVFIVEISYMQFQHKYEKKFYRNNRRRMCSIKKKNVKH